MLADKADEDDENEDDSVSDSNGEADQEANDQSAADAAQKKLHPGWQILNNVKATNVQMVSASQPKIQGSAVQLQL